MATNDAERKGYVSDFIKADTDKAVFLGNPLMDDMMTALIALGAETWANRRRVKIIEMLFEKKGKITRDMVEQYQLTPEDTKALEADRDAFITTVYGHFARGEVDMAALSPQTAKKQ